MGVFARVSVAGLGKAELEGDFLAGVGVEIEAEGVEALGVEGVGRKEAKVGVDGHDQDGGSGRSVEQIEVAEVEAWIFFRKLSVEVVRHKKVLPDGDVGTR